MKLLVLLLVLGCALALPRAPLRRRVSTLRATQLQAAAGRLRRAPSAAAAARRTMLISGYYRPLLQRRSGYEPETAMSAFATGDNVAAGSYLGTQLGNCPTCGDSTELFTPAGDEPIQPQLEAELPLSDLPADFPEAPPADVPQPLSDPEADLEVAPPLKPLRTPKKPVKKVQRPSAEEESDDIGEEVDVPTLGRRPYNTFFPIMFGHPSSARSGAGAGGAGGVTAIANSYSTGKGGVATSHATAYGAGAPARGRKRPQPADDEADDE